jgi:uncharacterized protein
MLSKDLGHAYARTMNRALTAKLNIAAFSDCAVQWLSYFALGILWVYRAVVSPVLFSALGPGCRFEPTCSEYAADAIGRYGIVAGGFMTLRRLLKCRPLGGWGFDPVPVLPLCARHNFGEHEPSPR